MIAILLAALALTLASLTAVFSAERFAHRLAGARGWGLTLALAAAAVLLRRGALGTPEAVATACVVLMAGIPAVATLASWRRRAAHHAR